MTAIYHRGIVALVALGIVALVALGIVAGGAFGIVVGTSTSTQLTRCIVAGYPVNATSAAQCAQIRYYGGQP